MACVVCFPTAGACITSAAAALPPHGAGSEALKLNDSVPSAVHGLKGEPAADQFLNRFARTSAAEVSSTEMFKPIKHWSTGASPWLLWMC
jgi:hypothetical protein